MYGVWCGVCGVWCGVGKLGMGVSMCLGFGRKMEIGWFVFEWVWVFLFLEEDIVYSHLYCYYILCP